VNKELRFFLKLALCLFLNSLMFISVVALPVGAEVLDTIWEKTTSLPYEIGGSSSVVFDKKIFLFSGSAYFAGSHDEILESTTSDVLGNLSTWTSNSILPSKLIWQDVVKKNNYFYVLGGFIDSIGGIRGSVNTVYRSKYLSSGFETWNIENNLPETLSLGRGAIVGDWIFYAGGFINSPNTRSNIVYKAKILSDNSLGNWDQAGTMPKPLIEFGLVSIKNKLIFFGGEEPGSVIVPTVRAATINETTGEIIGWEELTPLPIPSKFQAITKTDKGVVVIGGCYAGHNLNNVYYSNFDVDGNTGDWEESNNHLPWEICTATASILDGYIYVIGGFAVGSDIYGATNAVWKAKLSPEVLGDKTMIPMILIPGMGASYNKVLLHFGTAAPNTEWYMAPYVKNYDGLIESLKNSGYEMDKNLFVYNYDWRKPISDNALELKRFLDEKGLDKVDVIGHSMGGLIGARFGSLFPNRITSLISLGSPFDGSAKAYRIWEGADLSTFLGYEKIAISTFLNVNAGKFDSDVQTIQRNIPSFVNILPIKDYLKKQNGNMVPVNKMVWRNNLWPYLVNDVDKIASRSSNIIGSDIDTENMFTVKNRSIIDQVLGRWEDGKPIKTYFGMGDGTVIKESAMFDDATVFDVGNVSHGDLPSNNVVWGNISEILGISTPAASWSYPKYEKSLVMAIASPAEFVLTDSDGNNLGASSEVLVLDNPESDEYRVKIKPVDRGGKYTFYFGRISENDSAWDDFSGEITSGETDLIFKLDWNNKDLGADPIKRSMRRLEIINNALSVSNINKGEKQVFEVLIRNLGADILALPSLDENRQAAILRNAIQKVKQVQTAWYQLDPVFTDVVVYNLRLFTRDVLEAIGNL